MWEQLAHQEYENKNGVIFMEEITSKLKVPGGYIYKVIQVTIINITSNPKISTSMVFVPDRTCKDIINSI